VYATAVEERIVINQEYVVFHISTWASAKWVSGVSLHGSNPEPAMSALGQKRTIDVTGCAPIQIPVSGVLQSLGLQCDAAISSKSLVVQPLHGRSPRVRSSSTQCQ
jgi:hypothetical protein